MNSITRYLLSMIYLLFIEPVSSPDFSQIGMSKSGRLKKDSQRKLKIGILAHELTKNMKQHLFESLKDKLSDAELLILLQNSSQISSNYIKFVSQPNTDFYPILLTDDISSIIRQLHQLDGILLPGGSPNFQFLEKNFKNKNRIHVKMNLAKRYFKKTDQIIQTAKYINEHVRSFMVFGICLGFEMIILNESRFSTYLEHVDNQNKNEKLHLINQTSYFGEFLKHEVNAYQTKFTSGSQFYYNSKGVSTKAFKKSKSLVKNYKILADYKANEGRTYVSIIEHNTFPFFGVQFHPEKNMFDHSEYFLADHSRESVQLGQIFQKYLFKLLENNPKVFEFDGSVFQGIEPIVLPEIGYYKDLIVYNRNEKASDILKEFATK